jgi:uncharacterized protein YjeT (DUF2065 family)
MDDLLAAMGLVLVIEGALYALFPQAMINTMKRLPDIPPASLRMMGLMSVAVGWLLVKWIRG